MVQFCVSISPESVGAYRIRPDVGEQEMTATSILSLKACRKTQRGISRPGKCSPGTEQGFPARENVPRKPGKVFPVNFIMNSSFVGQIRSCGGRMRYAPTYLPFVRWGYGEGSFRFISCFSP